MTEKFDLEQNAFALLGIQPTASNKEIVEAFEDALADRRASEADLTSARQTLLVPKTRLEAELSSLLDTPFGEVRAIFDRLRAGSDDLSLRQLLPRLAPLSRLNLVTHLATNKAVTAELLIAFVGSLAEIEISAVLATLERTRKSAGFVSPDPASTREALHAMYAQHASSILDAYQRREIAARDVTQCVKATLTQSGAGWVDALEILLRAYRLVVQVDLSRIRGDIDKVAAELRKNPFSSTAEHISEKLNDWCVYCKPLQLIDAHKGRDEQEARAVFEMVRSLCIDLANDLKRSDLALAICRDCASAFKDLPRASTQIAEDVRQLERDRAAGKVIEDLKAKRYSDAISGIDSLLKGDLSEEERATFQKLQQVAQTKRRAMYTRWGYAAAAAIVLLVLWAQENPRQRPYPAPSDRTSDWRPSPPPTYPPTTPPSVPSPPRTSPLPTPPPDDLAEVKPPMGASLIFTRANIRYCQFQSERLEVARSMIGEETVLSSFNEAISDWNSRCASYRYRQSDLTAVQAELPLKRTELQIQGRTMVDNWRPRPPLPRADPWPGNGGAPVIPPRPAPPVPEVSPPPIVVGSLPKVEQPTISPPGLATTPDEMFEQAFGGTWALDLDACPGSGKKSMQQPVTITSGRAHTRTRTCVFIEKHGFGSSWNVKAECSGGPKKWVSKVSLIRQGDTLEWVNESGPTRYYRCSS